MSNASSPAKRELYILRHGNTFDAGDTILRVGRRTDLSLSKSGVAQIEGLRVFFQNQGIVFDHVFTSDLRRTQETARILLGPRAPFEPDSRFNEIDFGEDDGRPEAEVRERLGEKVMHLWEDEGILAKGWSPPRTVIEAGWLDFVSEARGRTLVVTSSSVARFAAAILPQNKPLSRLSTGGFFHFVYEGTWALRAKYSCKGDILEEANST